MAKGSALKRWTIIFSFLDVLILLAGIFVIVVAFLWRGILAQPVQQNDDIFLHLTVSDSILSSGIAFSITVFFSVLVSLWTLTTTPTKENAATTPVVAYIICLLFAFLGTLSIGTAIWFFTLRERAAFTPVWEAQSTQTQIFLQNSLQCCGWFNATIEGLFTSDLQTGFCADPSSIPVDPDPNIGIGCVSAFVKKADFILNNIFSTVYGFVTIEAFLLIVAATIAQLRIQERRFLRIDYKLLGGKGGFV